MEFYNLLRLHNHLTSSTQIGNFHKQLQGTMFSRYQMDATHSHFKAVTIIRLKVGATERESLVVMALSLRETTNFSSTRNSVPTPSCVCSYYWYGGEDCCLAAVADQAPSGDVDYTMPLNHTFKPQPGSTNLTEVTCHTPCI